MATLTVTFCSTSNDPREIPKTLITVQSKSCTVIEPFNLETPRVKLKYNASLINCSMAKITLGGREYIYTINPNYTVENGIMYIDLEMSYLDTYSNEVLGSMAHITRSGSSNETMLEDNLATTYADDKISCFSLGQAFSPSYSYIWVKGVTNATIEND